MYKFLFRYFLNTIICINIATLNLFSRFTLGTRAVANHYYQQFKEIFTEEGRKNVRIKHIISGQTRIACTPGMQRAHQQVYVIFFSIEYFLINYLILDIPFLIFFFSGATCEINGSTIATNSITTDSTAGL